MPKNGMPQGPKGGKILGSYKNVVAEITFFNKKTIEKKFEQNFFPPKIFVIVMWQNKNEFGDHSFER